jgi:methylated-DNA-[protein]-cysteine S-methyltransferase
MKLKEKVYRLLKKVPKGKVTTYGDIGKKLGTKAYRAIGQILKRNPCAPKVPCHRVVCSDGSLGGYQGKNVKRKKELLKKEGIIVEKGKIKEFEKKKITFSS